MSSDPFGAIGSMFNSVVQGVEQNVENTLGTVMNEFGGAQSGKGIMGGGFINDTMDQFSLGGVFGANGEGFAGELFGSFMGSEFGILGGIFAGNSDPSSVGNGYAPPPPPPCGNTGSTGSTHGATPGSGPQQLDPRIDQEIAALETLMANFDKVSNNGTMTKADLQKASLDSSNPELQKAAKFFLANQDCLNQLMAGNNGNGATWDRMYALDQGLSELKASAGGTQTVNGPPPGPSGTTPTSTASTSTGDTGSTTSTTTSGQNYGDYSQLIADLQQQIADLKKSKTSGTSGSTSTTSSKKSEGSMDKQINKELKTVGDLQDAIAKDMDALDNTTDEKSAFKLEQDIQTLNKIMEMIENMAKSMHDAQMNAIANIR